MKMSQYAAMEGITLYKGLDKDPMSAITSALIHNIGTMNLQLARIDYQKLLSTIYQRGREGKDIRYAAKKLNEISRSAREEGADNVAELAAAYARQLPKPIERRRIKLSKLEMKVA